MKNQKQQIHNKKLIHRMNMISAVHSRMTSPNPSTTLTHNLQVVRRFEIQNASVVWGHKPCATCLVRWGCFTFQMCGERIGAQQFWYSYDIIAVPISSKYLNPIIWIKGQSNESLTNEYCRVAPVFLSLEQQSNRHQPMHDGSPMQHRYDDAEDVP